MSTIIPLPVPEGIGRRADVSALAFALDRMTPGLWAPILPGENLDDALTRREAARDILDDLLAEYGEAVSS
jgi:hypothetical protein